MGHSDVGRADARCRAMMEPHIENFIATAARVLGSKNEDEAILAVSAMVGALAISRVITDPGAPMPSYAWYAMPSSR
jgi:TetR/AcrR family transcriptional regulator, transcriptional repressor for nem operon